MHKMIVRFPWSAIELNASQIEILEVALALNRLKIHIGLRSYPYDWVLYVVRMSRALFTIQKGIHSTLCRKSVSILSLSPLFSALSLFELRSSFLAFVCENLFSTVWNLQLGFSWLF